MVKNLITEHMIEHFNLKMEKEGSCLRYVRVDNNEEVHTYRLTIVDKYIDNKYYQIPSITDECEIMVRGFFKAYGIEDTGYTNSVITIWACGRDKED